MILPVLKSTESRTSDSGATGTTSIETGGRKLDQDKYTGMDSLCISPLTRFVIQVVRSTAPSHEMNSGRVEQARKNQWQECGLRQSNVSRGRLDT